jgi:hypothetical protein
MSSSSAGGESTTFPRMFSSSADEVFKISMFAYLVNNIGERYTRKNVLFLRRRGERYFPKNVFFLR